MPLAKNKRLWLPDAYLKKVLPEGFFKRRVLNKNLSINKLIFRALVTAATLDERELKDSYTRAIKFYRQKIKRLEAEDVKNPEKKALNNEKLIKERIKNVVLYDEAQRLKEEHKGEYYIWLPSSSKEPRPEHQLKYGKVFRCGVGEFPNDDYGCKCGAYFLDDDPLNNDVLSDSQKKALEKMIKKDKNTNVNNFFDKLGI